MSALLKPACGPESQVTGSASRAVLACHQVSATTATALSSTATTARTPGILPTLAASKDLSLPVNTGQALMAALSMPGSCRSVPKTCLPLSLSTVSRRFTG